MQHILPKVTVRKGMRQNVLLTAADSVFYRFIHHHSRIPSSPTASFWMWDGALCLFLCGHSNCAVTTPPCERIPYKLRSAIPCSRMGISMVDADRPPTGQRSDLLGQINRSINQVWLTYLFWKSMLDALFFLSFPSSPHLQKVFLLPSAVQ